MAKEIQSLGATCGNPRRKHMQALGVAGVAVLIFPRLSACNHRPILILSRLSAWNTHERSIGTKVAPMWCSCSHGKKREGSGLPSVPDSGEAELLLGYLQDFL